MKAGHDGTRWTVGWGGLGRWAHGDERRAAVPWSVVVVSTFDIAAFCGLLLARVPFHEKVGWGCDDEDGT